MLIVILVTSNTVHYVKLTVFVQLVHHLWCHQVMDLVVFVFLRLFSKVALVFVQLAKLIMAANAFLVLMIVICVQQLLLVMNAIHRIFLILLMVLVIVIRTKQSKELHVFVFLDTFNITIIVLYVILVVVFHVKFLMFVSVVLVISF